MPKVIKWLWQETIVIYSTYWSWGWKQEASFNISLDQRSEQVINKRGKLQESLERERKDSNSLSTWQETHCCDSAKDPH